LAVRSASRDSHTLSANPYPAWILSAASSASSPTSTPSVNRRNIRRTHISWSARDFSGSGLSNSSAHRPITRSAVLQAVPVSASANCNNTSSRARTWCSRDRSAPWQARNSWYFLRPSACRSHAASYPASVSRFDSASAWARIAPSARGANSGQGSPRAASASRVTWSNAAWLPLRLSLFSSNQSNDPSTRRTESKLVS
jgi:hypothetical protein